MSLRLRQQSVSQGQSGHQAGPAAQPPGADRPQHSAPALRHRQEALQGGHWGQAYQVSHSKLKKKKK